MVRPFKAYVPDTASAGFVAETAVLIGQVFLEEASNIWYNTVVRGDVEPIRIGKRTNVQDQVVLHTSKGFPLTIGADVTIGHGAIVHGCTISDRVLVGMGAIVLDGAVIEEDVIIGAGALVPPGKRIPKGVLALGSPAKAVRELTEAERLHLKASADNYVQLSMQYKSK